MTRGILLAGNESTLLSAIAAEAAKRVESYATAIIPNRFPLPDGVIPIKQESPGKAIPLSWNPGSPISARSLVLASENRLTQINNAILICSPPAVYKTTSALTPEEIEILVNDHIKGWFFLIRELSLYFRRIGSGSLALVTLEPNPDTGKNIQTDILGPAAAASFRTFVNGILPMAANEPFQLMGFMGSEAAEEEFAPLLFKIIDEDGEKKNSGRWHRFQKRGFLKYGQR